MLQEESLKLELVMRARVDGAAVQVDLHMPDRVITTTVQGDLLFERVQELVNNQLRYLTNEMTKRLKRRRQHGTI